MRASPAAERAVVQKCKANGQEGRKFNETRAMGNGDREVVILCDTAAHSRAAFARRLTESLTEVTPALRQRAQRGRYEPFQGGSMVSLQVLVVALATTATPDAVLLDFYSDSCGPCRQAAPMVEQLRQRGYPIRKVNIDQEPQLASQFRITAVPTFVMVVGGREVARREGFPGVEALEQMCQMGVPRNETVRAQSPDPFAAPTGPAPSPFTSNETAVAAMIAQPSIAPQAPAAASSGLHDKILAASVRLHIDDPQGHSVGSGTIIDARGGDALVITCGHLFRDSQGKGKIRVDLFGPGAPQGLEGTLLNWDDENDVAVVCFQTNYPVTVARIAPANASPQVGDSVVSAGCDGGATPTAHPCSVTAINKFQGPKNVVVNDMPVQGRSGGGLFNAQGHLIGVCNAADPSENLGLFAAGELIRGELEEVKLLAFCLDAGPTAAPSALAAAAPASASAEPFASIGVSQQPLTSLASVPANVGAIPDASVAPSAFDMRETAAINAVQDAHGDAEVICIVRSRSDAQAKSEIVVLDKASPEFLSRLAAERNNQSGRHLTSMTMDWQAQPPPVYVLDGFPTKVMR